MSETTAPVAVGRRQRPPARHHGILPLNKGRGITSFQAVREVRRILGERRVGHAGTLDPAATGLLPICVGQATRLVDYLHQQPKRYHCVLRLGERSTTMDLEGEVSRGGDASAVDAAAVRRRWRGSSATSSRSRRCTRRCATTAATSTSSPARASRSSGGRGR